MLSGKNTPSKEKEYRKYGKNFGLIFQATDDLLDYEGKKNITGKQTQKDLKKNKGSILKYKDSDEIKVYCKKLALGATIIEKHITIDRSLEGPDHLASMEPEEFKKLVISLRTTDILLGSKIKKPSASEKKNLRLARKVIVAEKSIKKGEIYSSSNLTLKRAGKGLSPNIWDSLIGKVAIKDFDKNQIIKLK